MSQLLSGQQISELQEALITAFPTRDELRIMVRVELNEQLEAIADGANQRIVTFNLVSWAERMGKIDALVQGALRQNSGNPRLQEFVRRWGGSPPTTAQMNAAPNTTESIGPVSIDVFLSYSRKDSDFMRPVRDALRSAGLAVWTDEGLEPGTTSWSVAIEEAIAQASAMVVILTPQSKASPWVENEVRYAQLQRKPVYPLMAAGDSANAVPISLISAQWVDGRKDISNAVDKELIPVLQSRLRLSTPADPVIEALAVEPAKPSPATRTRAGIIVVAAAVILGGAAVYMVERLPWLVGTASNAPTAAATATTASAFSNNRLASPAATVATSTEEVGTSAETTTEAVESHSAAAPVNGPPLDPGTTLTNEIDGSVFVFVPGGTFTMGSSDSVEEAQTDEKPQSEQTLAGFWIMRTEVTVAQYGMCVQAGACLGQYIDENRGEYPIAEVSWSEASDYAKWIGARLPTEAEWERACRGNDGRIYPWGNDPPGKTLANFGRNADNYTSPVGSYPEGASPYGLLDMSGNVREWTSSLYAPYPYVPTDGREDAAARGQRVARGGSWSDYRGKLHCAARAAVDAADENNGLGFRLVLK